MLALRPDLEIVAAEPEGGYPALLVHDPVSGTFDRVEWPETDIIELLRKPIRFIELHAAFLRGGTLKPTLRELGAYIAELETQGWLRGAAFADERFRERKTGGVIGVFSRLLFFTVPLLRPERFLRATAPFVRIAANPLTVFALFLCGVFGLYLTLPRWEEYWADCAASLRPSGVPAIFFALVLVKLLHEFAHAYAATLAGARVSGMGVALIFCLPLPYTDVTDAWRLPWRRRFRVASAGIGAETAVAGVALLLWALSPPGAGAETLARLSSVALVSTLLTNLNPGPRFDGYYMLCCLLRTENLRARGTAELRRLVWLHVFGIGTPSGFRRSAGGRSAGALLYAFYAVFYRASLGVALALLAYSFLPKALALPVVVLEAWLFILAPVVIEAVRLGRNWRGMRITGGLLIAMLCVSGAVVWFFGNWPRRAHFPGVVRAAAEGEVRTRRSGIVLSVSNAASDRGGRGGQPDRIEAGDVLARLEDGTDAPAVREAEWALREAEIASAQSWRGDGSRTESPARAAEVERRRVELAALRKREEYLAVAAPLAGTVADWDRTLAPGTPVARGVTMGRIADGEVRLLSCYPDMETAGKLEAGAAVRFFPDSGDESVEGTIARIEQSRPEILEDAELAGALGAVASGDGTGGAEGTGFVLPRPYAKVTVMLDRALSRSGQTGRVWAWTRPESLAAKTLRWLEALAVRESAF